MGFAMFGILAIAAPNGAVVETRFVQVYPAIPVVVEPVRSRGQERAVVLIHGMYINPLKKEGISRAVLRNWQKPGSVMVTRLSREADVFSFAYSQTVAADNLAEWPDLTVAVGRLRQAGYREIVLVGYSAGGLIARQCVENNPQLGVAKVIQVCAPNIGTSWAKFPTVRVKQREFQASLTKEARKRALRERGDRSIPDDVQFACIVGTSGIGGDGLVNLKSQWSEDLQQQGIPAYGLDTNHWQAMRSPKGAELVAALVSQPLTRWDGLEVSRARAVIFKRAR